LNYQALIGCCSAHNNRRWSTAGSFGTSGSVEMKKQAAVAGDYFPEVMENNSDLYYI